MQISTYGYPCVYVYVSSIWLGCGLNLADPVSWDLDDLKNGNLKT